ncbi:hypothetical protein [Pigmentiphaga soli]
MSTPTREEFEARIAASEARADARFIAFEKTIGDAVAGIRHENTELRGDIKAFQAQIAGEFQNVHGEFRRLGSIKTTVWGATAVIVGSIFAALALMVSSFDSGRDTAAQTPAQPAAAQPAPIIIQVPQPAAGASPAPAAPSQTAPK